MRSLRWRFVAGSVLWTCGLLMLAHLLSMALIHHLPRLAPNRGPMVAIGLVLAGAGFALVVRGLSRVGELRRRLLDVRQGRGARIEGEHPSELQPLVDDLNGLLEHREEVVRRALAKAGDLAHGLKTPLALLAQEAERAAAEGHRELAAGIAQQVDKMRRQLDYHLAQARAAAAGATLGARSDLLISAEALVRTVQRLYAGRELAIEIDIAADIAVKAQREDLEEMLGNLLDNACKWTTSKIRVSAGAAAGTVVVQVDDDGPGLAAESREKVLQRGVRADQAAPGSGLGLAIVRDLAELYGGGIRLGPSPLGGLRATLSLPLSRG